MPLVLSCNTFERSVSVGELESSLLAQSRAYDHPEMGHVRAMGIQFSPTEFEKVEIEGLDDVVKLPTWRWLRIDWSGEGDAAQNGQFEIEVILKSSNKDVFDAFKSDTDVVASEKKLSIELGSHPQTKLAIVTIRVPFNKITWDRTQFWEHFHFSLEGRPIQWWLSHGVGNHELISLDLSKTTQEETHRGVEVEFYNTHGRKDYYAFLNKGGRVDELSWMLKKVSSSFRFVVNEGLGSISFPEYILTGDVVAINFIRENLLRWKNINGQFEQVDLTMTHPSGGKASLQIKIRKVISGFSQRQLSHILKSAQSAKIVFNRTFDLSRQRIFSKVILKHGRSSTHIPILGMPDRYSFR